MVESNHDEERLARVERMLAQCRRENAALTAIAAAKIVDVVVAAVPFRHGSIDLPEPKRSN